MDLVADAVELAVAAAGSSAFNQRQQQYVLVIDRP
jgi:hypothetical protein